MSFILFKLDSVVFLVFYVLPDKAEISNIKFLSWFASIRDIYVDIVKGSNILEITQPALSALTTLALEKFLLKHFCWLSVVFSWYDSNNYENLGKAVSTIATNGVSPKFLRATFRLDSTEHQ